MNYAAKQLQEVAVSDRATRQYVRNIIYIFNHVLSYGFIEKSVDGGQTAPSHYWQLMSHYLEGEHSSIQYVNELMPDEDDEKIKYKKKVDKDWEPTSDEDRALTWLVLALSEKDLLYYTFLMISRHGKFLHYYDEEESFFFNGRERLLEVAQQVYKGRWSVDGDLHSRYIKWLDKERQKSNEMY